MKIFIASIALSIPLAILTMVGILPAIIGAASLMMIVVIGNVILAWFTRGAPMEFMKARMSGGMILGIVKRTRNIVFKRFYPHAGMINTERHGAFTVMPNGLYSADGVMVGIAPEKVGYNVRVDDAQLVEEMKKRGIDDIREVCDVDDFGFVIDFKNDPRIKNLKITPQQYTTSFDDFYKYTTEASNPIHQDTNVKLGIAQGMIGKEARRAFLFIAAGLAVFFALLGIAVLLQLRGDSAPIHVIIDNVAHVVKPTIPA